MSTTPCKVRIFDPEGKRPPIPSYSHISATPLSPTTTLITISGQIGDAHTPFPTQVRSALSKVDKCLSAAGATKANVFSTRQYVVGLGSMSEEDWVGRREVCMEWLGGLTPPPLTLIGVERLVGEGVLFEVEVQAVVYSEG